MKRSLAIIIVICMASLILAIALGTHRWSSNHWLRHIRTEVSNQYTDINRGTRAIKTIRDFELREIPSSITLRPTPSAPASVPITLLIDPLNGWRGPLVFFAGVKQEDKYRKLLPPGIRVTFPSGHVIAKGAQRISVKALVSADASALNFPSIFMVTVLAAGGRIQHSTSVQVIIPPVSLTNDFKVDLDPTDISTEHSGVYDVHVLLKPARGFTGSVKLGLLASPLDDILKPSAAHKYIGYRFTSGELSAAHPSSTLHLTVPLGIPTGYEYQFIVTVAASNGKIVVREPFSVFITIDENAVVTGA